MADVEDQPMTDSANMDASRLPLSTDERKVLELWDRLQELQLEIAIINSQNSLQPGMAILSARGNLT